MLRALRQLAIGFGAAAATYLLGSLFGVRSGLAPGAEASDHHGRVDLGVVDDARHQPALRDEFGGAGRLTPAGFDQQMPPGASQLSAFAAIRT